VQHQGSIVEREMPRISFTHITRPKAVRFKARKPKDETGWDAEKAQLQAEQERDLKAPGWHGGNRSRSPKMNISTPWRWPTAKRRRFYNPDHTRPDAAAMHH
jgi:hypothetical protein